MLSMASTCGDFLSHRHHIERWFGVSHFVLVEPSACDFSSKVRAITTVTISPSYRHTVSQHHSVATPCQWQVSMSEAKFLVSALSVVVGNMAAPVPVFIQVFALLS